MSIPLEDSYADVVSKAMRGRGSSAESVAKTSGVPAETVTQIKAGEAKDPAALRAVATALDLKADALVALSSNGYPAKEPAFVDGFARFNTPFEDMTVNSYLVWDPVSKQAAAFDTGGDCSDMLQLIADKNLKVTDIFLTHTHGDHIFDLDRLKEKTGAQVHISELEPFGDAKQFKPGTNFALGSLAIGTRATIGHSKGGTTYVVSGLGMRIAVVGDALFAGSMGGGAVSYEKALATNRSEIFSLPDDTLVCPGHGPVTTVERERTFNPFFP